MFSDEVGLVGEVIQMINSKYFIFQQIADGVYAALHRPGGSAVSNACIVDLGDQTLVFDTTLTPQSGTDLNLAAEALTDHPVTLVVNSHYHIDHVWGNQAFHPDSDLITSEDTFHLMARKTLEEYRLLKDDAAEKARTIDAMEKTADGQPKLWMSYVAGVQEALPRLRPRLPNITFDQQITIHGSRRSLILRAFSGGHTLSDVVMFLPGERILCTGDLVYANMHPYLSEADIDRLPVILKELISLNPAVVVPGHGSTASTGAMQSMLDYCQRLEAIATRLLNGKNLPAGLKRTPLPAAYKEWDLQDHFLANLQWMVGHLAKNSFVPAVSSSEMILDSSDKRLMQAPAVTRAIGPDSI